MTLKLEGVFPPIPTPFDADGNLLLDKVKANLALWNRTGLHGYVVLGSNGEAVMLAESEKAALWEAARAAIPRDKLFLAGAGVESTRNCIALAKRAAELGADAAMFVTPNYYKAEMRPPALINHYRAIADASPIPTIIYNMPGATGIDIDAATVIELAQHPNIIGIKDSSGNVAKFADIIRAVRSDFSVIAGSGSYFYPALCIGAKGAVAALANVAPRECLAIYAAFRAQQHDQARELQLRLIRLNAAVTTRWNIPGLKAALEELQQGFYGGPSRLPLRPLGDEDRRALRQIMQDAGVI
ncbi:MAG: dihydrodipicolinate synthase family protein [Chloroflexota bacterium]|nr:dihydrodipicolinate synthase family protein [Chloroflexota bacterium]